LGAKAFSVVNQCRRLPALLENFLGDSFHWRVFFGSIFADDVRNNFFLVEEEINEYMCRYDVRVPPAFHQCLNDDITGRKIAGNYRGTR